MAMVVPFFPRQTLVGRSIQGAFGYYSEPFDLSQYSNLGIEVNVFGYIGAGTQQVQVSFESVGSLESGSWLEQTDGGFTTIAGAPILAGSRYMGFNNFGRVQVRFLSNNTDDQAITLSVIGVARESGGG
jgi:hypothetical protein